MAGETEIIGETGKYLEVSPSKGVLLQIKTMRRDRYLARTVIEKATTANQQKSKSMADNHYTGFYR